MGKVVLKSIFGVSETFGKGSHIWDGRFEPLSFLLPSFPRRRESIVKTLEILIWKTVSEFQKWIPACMGMTEFDEIPYLKN